MVTITLTEQQLKNLPPHVKDCLMGLFHHMYSLRDEEKGKIGFAEKQEAEKKRKEKPKVQEMELDDIPF